MTAAIKNNVIKGFNTKRPCQISLSLIIFNRQPRDQPHDKLMRSMS